MILSAADLARCEEIAAEGAGKIKPIVDAVAEATGLQGRQIYGQSRVQRIAHARQLVYYLARMQGVSLPVIGRVMNRDHTTVLHGVRAEEARRKNMGATPGITGEKP